MKKIIVFTSTRAEYGLLRNLIFKLTENKNFNVKILVTGTHLSRNYGLTINEMGIGKLEIAIVTAAIFIFPIEPKLKTSGFKKADIATKTAAKPTRL